jgi:hypothetical protein
VRVITSPCEQYEGTVHQFIGTGHSPDKITFVSLITNHNHDTNYQGLSGLFLFKSVLPFISNVSSCWSSLRHIPSCCACLHIVLPKVFLLRGPSAEKKAPNKYSSRLRGISTSWSLSPLKYISQRKHKSKDGRATHARPKSVAHPRTQANSWARNTAQRVCNSNGAQITNTIDQMRGGGVWES